MTCYKYTWQGTDEAAMLTPTLISSRVLMTLASAPVRRIRLRRPRSGIHICELLLICTEECRDGAGVASATYSNYNFLLILGSLFASIIIDNLIMSARLICLVKIVGEKSGNSNWLSISSNYCKNGWNSHQFYCGGDDGTWSRWRIGGWRGPINDNWI